jgi:cyclase
MLQNRLIPCLLINNERLVKTIKFQKPSYVGDPLNAIRIFNEKEVDEILIFDIGVTKSNKEPDFKYIEKLASECFMPLCYGGGISNLEQVKKLVSIGVEKVSLNTAILNNYDLIYNTSKLFGSQNVVASIDINNNIFNKYYIFNKKKLDINNHIQNIINSGAGEILINCVHKDGTMSGPDLKLLTYLSKEINIPIIYQGGISSLDDIYKVFNYGINAVSAGSFFIYHGKHRAVLISYPNLNNSNEISNNL